MKIKIHMKLIVILMVLFSINVYSNEEKLNFYLEDKNIEKAVAQLFVVGYPGDIVNYTACRECDFLLNELRVGGIILNQYNVPKDKLSIYEREEAFNIIARLTEDINYKALKHNRTKFTLPPTIMVDFENYRYSSIKYPLASIPSALSIASTGDTTNAFLAGKLTGYHLGQLGVNAILGPVLDQNVNMEQGVANSTIRDRSFSDRNGIIYKFASEYISGLKTANLGVFAKHFPSYSSIDGNAHSTPASYLGSSANLKKGLEVFKSLNSQVDGFMTSHLNTGDTHGYLPFTFSKDQVEYYFRNKTGIESDNILITDDLSGMQPVKEYMNKKNRKFANVAAEAFIAGHDYLLFSHYGEVNGFTKKDLVDSIKLISKKVRVNKKYKNRLRESLRRILKLKNSFSQEKTVNDFDYDAATVFKGSKFENTDGFIRGVLEDGVIAIKSPTDGFPKIQDMSDDMTFLLITKEKYFNSYQQFNDMGDSYSLSSPPLYKNDIQKYYQYLLAKLKKYDFIYITIDGIDDANAIDYIRLYAPKYLGKLILLLHESPSNLKPAVLSESKYIYGNFSRNPVSYEIDNKYIFGELTAKSRKYLPMSLTNGTFHNSNDMPNPTPNSIEKTESKIIFYETKREKMLQQEIDELRQLKENNFLSIENRLDIIETNKVLYFSMIILFILLMFTFLIPVYRTHENTNQGYKLIQVAKFFWINNIYRKRLLAVFVIIFSLITIYIFPYNSMIKDFAEEGGRKAITKSIYNSDMLKMHSKQN